MKAYEFKRICYPKLRRFVYKHKGNGLIVDSISNPLRKVATKGFSSVLSNLVKPMAKKSYKIWCRTRR